MKFIHIIILLLLIACNKTNTGSQDDSKVTLVYNIADAYKMGSDKKNDQKEITVKGISWGVNEVMSGDIILNLNDQVQGKDQIADFICVFPSLEKDFVKIAKSNTIITVRGKLKKTKYHVSLYECKIMSMEFPN